VNRALGLLISGVAAGGGFVAVIWPRLFLTSLEEQYTPSRARIAGLIVFLMGCAGAIAILQYKGGPIDFFPV
jgi:hypothetical protein